MCWKNNQMPKQCGAFRIVRAENLHGFGKSNDNMSVSRIGPHIRSGSILLQKSAAADGPVGHSLRAAGVDRPVPTPSTQLQRYAKHKA
jgi:hypothetical protein